MDDKERQAAFLTALTTEHFVLQTAASATVSEAAARASLYVLSLSSSLVAMGFASRSQEVFLSFAAAVLPALFSAMNSRNRLRSWRASSVKTSFT